MYKAGDRVLLYTWDELVNMYGLQGTGHCINLKIPNGFWDKRTWNIAIPKDSIVTVDYIDIDGIFYRKGGGFNTWKITEFIKCHAPEYYLQQIKEELDTE